MINITCDGTSRFGRIESFINAEAEPQGAGQKAMRG